MSDNLITKTAFASIMGVDKAQPTRWAKLGMPVRSGGLVEPVEAAAWMRANVDPAQRERRSVGASQVERAGTQRQSDALDQLVRTTLRLAVHAVPDLVAAAASDAGLTQEQGKALHSAALTRAPEIEVLVRAQMDVPEGEAPPLEPTSPHTPGSSLDLIFERARVARAQADAQEMENDLRRGEVVRVKDAIAPVAKAYARVRTRLLAIPTSAAQQLARINQPREMAAALESLIVEALEELSAPKIGDASA